MSFILEYICVSSAKLTSYIDNIPIHNEEIALLNVVLLYMNV